MDELLESYERVPYPADPVYQTHPDALATAAHLAGMRPAPVTRCRVLDLGCGTAGNLLAMALALPESRFVGIDLSPRQIADGRAVADELGLENLELRAADILTLGEELGVFDYIICHGVYSWCPPPVQERILQIVERHLAPEGVAYLGYNVLPGWRKLALRRDLMQWGGRGETDPLARVREGKRFLQLVGEATASVDAAYSQALMESSGRLAKLPDAYLLHEYLEPYNEPLLFHEMVARAASHGLAYLGESCRPLDLSDLGPPAQAWLEEDARSRVEVEQSLDFFRNASFRRSLFCRAGVRLDEPSPERLRPLCFNTLCQPLSRDPDVKSPREELFKGDNRQLATDIPLVKAILVALHAIWPRTLTLPELTAEVRHRLDAVEDPELTEELVAEAALQCFGASLLAVHVWAPPFCATVSDRPVASPLARLQARAALRQPGSAACGVSNLRHREVVLERADLEVLTALDGTCDRAALTAALTHAGEDPAAVTARVAQSLARLAHAALLVS